MENWNGADPHGVRGRDGPLHVTDGANALGTPLYGLFVDAGAEAGFGAPPTTTASGRRGSARCR